MWLLGLGTSISHVTMATMPSSGFVLAIGGLNGTQWLHVVPTNVYAYTILITDKSSIEKFDRQSI